MSYVVLAQFLDLGIVPIRVVSMETALMEGAIAL